MLQSNLGDFNTTQHTGDFLDTAIDIKWLNRTQGHTIARCLAHLPLPVGLRGNLRQVRHTQHLAFAAQFWKPTDPKQQAVKRQLDALATLWSDGALGQVAPIWNEVKKNGIPSALDARIQWDRKTPYFLRWGKIVEDTPPVPTDPRKVT